ncbi:MAG TPA: DUF86 domain-containing protein [Chitinophagales bacterium]|nr:DUF86 domain-containing protein [Chitinophagales bacterium]
MRNKFGDKERVLHILDAIIEIENYIYKRSKEEFLNNSMMRFASIKQIEIIGEAANQVTQETQDKFSEIEWKQIIGLRNILVHEYFGVDDSLIWQIVITDIPELKVRIIEVLKTL